MRALVPGMSKMVLAKDLATRVTSKRQEVQLVAGGDAAVRSSSYFGVHHGDKPRAIYLARGATSLACKLTLHLLATRRARLRTGGGNGPDYSPGQGS